MLIKDANGKEIEVFTAEELQAKTKDAVESAAKAAAEKALADYKAANPDKTAELTTLQTKLKNAEDELAAAVSGGGDKAGQVQRLRAERDAAEAAFKEFQTKTLTEINNFKAAVVGDAKNEIIGSLVGADAELKKKVEFFYDTFKGDAVTKQEIKDRVQMAYQLATGKKAEPGVLDGVINAGARGAGGGGEVKAGSKPTDNEVRVGNVLGITDADREKYRGKVRSSSAD